MRKSFRGGQKANRANKTEIRPGILSCSLLICNTDQRGIDSAESKRIFQENINFMFPRGSDMIHPGTLLRNRFQIQGRQQNTAIHHFQRGNGFDHARSAERMPQMPLETACRNRIRSEKIPESFCSTALLMKAVPTTTSILWLRFI